MTEAEWLASDDPRRMLSYFFDRAGYVPGQECFTDRKLRLFACAVWRRAWPKNARRAEEVEEWLEGGRRPTDHSWWVSQTDSRLAARDAAHYLDAGPLDDRRFGAALLREIVGDPFRPTMRSDVIPPAGSYLDGKRLWLSARWLTPQVLDLAQATYDERLPDGTLDAARLAVLSDALEEAGCFGEKWFTHPVVAHLRSAGPHFRGCWAVDLILGKS